MASIYKEVRIAKNAQIVWKSICDVGNVHKIFPGVLTAARRDGENARIITFAGGMKIRELIISIDHTNRRFVYAAVEGGVTTHHNASWQIFEDGDSTCRFVWISDFLPDTSAKKIQQFVDAGATALQQTLEARQG